MQLFRLALPDIIAAKVSTNFKSVNEEVISNALSNSPYALLTVASKVGRLPT